MDVLPRDILENILLRLSVTILVTVASHVCRSWRAIIFDPTFVNNHVSISTDDDDNTLLFHRNNRFLLYSSTGNLTSVVGPRGSFPEEKMDNKPITLVCNGLVLYTYRLTNFIKLYLCNPILNQSIPLTPIEIPPSIRRSRSFSGHDVKLPEQDVGCGFGFGFAPITNQYKIVVMSRSNNYIERRTNVYCSTFDANLGKKTISGWKIVDSFDQMIQCDPSGVSVNGRIHWLLFPHAATTRDLILTFNITTEELGYMFRLSTNIDRPGEYQRSKRRLGVLGGTNLYVCVDYIQNFNTCRSNVWVMDESQELYSWFDCYWIYNLTLDYDWFSHWKKDLFVFRRRNGQYFVVERKYNDTADSIDDLTKVGLEISFVSTFVPCFLPIVEDEK